MSNNNNHKIRLLRNFFKASIIDLDEGVQITFFSLLIDGNHASKIKYISSPRIFDVLCATKRLIANSSICRTID